MIATTLSCSYPLTMTVNILPVKQNWVRILEVEGTPDSDGLSNSNRELYGLVVGKFVETFEIDGLKDSNTVFDGTLVIEGATINDGLIEGRLLDILDGKSDSLNDSI